MSVLINTKKYLNILGTQYDDLITTLGSAVIEEVKSKCKQPIVQEAVLYKFNNNDFNEDGYLRVKYTSPVNIISIKKSLPLTNSWTTLASTEYQMVDYDNVPYIDLNGGFDSKYVWEVYLAVGYSTLPYDIAQLQVELTANKFKESKLGDDRLGKAMARGAIGDSDLQISYQDLNKRFEQVCEAYKLNLS